MSALGVYALTGPLATLRRLERLVLGAGVLGLAALAVAVVVTPATFSLPSLGAGEDAGRFAAATAVYALSHAFRVLRLALLTYHPGLRLRRVLQVHLLTAGLSVVLPFKLGELIRVRELGVVLGGLRAGIVTVWLERTLDAAVLALLIVVCAVALPGSLTRLTPLLVVLCVFVAATVALLTVVPANLRLVMLHLVRRRTSERGVTALVALREVLAVLRPAPERLAGRLPTLLLLSLFVWAAEVAAVSIALPRITADVSQLSTGVLSALASVSSGSTPLMAAFGERLAEALADFGSPADPSAYRQVLVLPALVAAAVAGVAHLRHRREGTT